MTPLSTFDPVIYFSTQNTVLISIYDVDDVGVYNSNNTNLTRRINGNGHDLLKRGLSGISAVSNSIQNGTMT